MSGGNDQPRKRTYLNGYRGFKSHPLSHTFTLINTALSVLASSYASNCWWRLLCKSFTLKTFNTSGKLSEVPPIAPLTRQLDLSAKLCSLDSGSAASVLLAAQSAGVLRGAAWRFRN